MGMLMNLLLFGQLLLRGCIKVLQEFTESNDMDQFMGDDIKAKGEKLHGRRSFQGGMNGMVLKAYFVIVENTRT